MVLQDYPDDLRERQPKMIVERDKREFVIGLNVTAVDVESRSRPADTLTAFLQLNN